MLNGRKIVQGLVALALLICSIIVSFGLIGHDRQSTQAQANQVTSKDFSIPKGNDPWGTAFDSNGNVWVAVPSCDPTPTCPSSTPGKIAVFNPSTSLWITTHQLPSGYAQPFFLTFDGQGRVWFAMPMNNSIGVYNPAKNTFQKWAVPTKSSGPWDVAVDHNGMIWFTEHYGHQIGRFNPSTHTFLQIATPSTVSNPYGITVDANNNIWFTENNSSVALIAEYTTGGNLQEYKIRSNPPSGLTPHLITVDPNGNIWWTEGFVGEIGELIVSQAVPGTNNGVTEYAYQQVCSCGEHTSGISFDSNGLIWFDDSLQNIFGSFPESGNSNSLFKTYKIPTPGGHSHDGLDVDNQNRIWFDEEFANKLAEAIQSGVPMATPTSSPSPSPTNTTTPSPSPTLSPTATPSPGTTLAQDTFQRPNQTHWGTASDGQTWGGDANSLSVFTISNNTGQVSSSSGSHSAVLGPVATNAQVLFSGSLSNFTSNNLGAVLRWTNSNNWYKAYIDGTNLVIQKKVNGTSTTLKMVPFAATANTSYTLQFTVIGTALSASVWQTGSTPPTTPMVTATDSSLFQPGQCGLRMLVQNGAVAKVTSFIAVSQ